MRINHRFVASILSTVVICGLLGQEHGTTSAGVGHSHDRLLMPNVETRRVASALTDDLPDLIVRNITSIKGTSLKVAVSNIGKGNSGPCLIHVEVWKNGATLLERDQAVHPLHPGQYNIVTIDTSPQEVSKNGYIIKLMVDPKNVVEESNENNNSKCKGCIAIPGKK